MGCVQDEVFVRRNGRRLLMLDTLSAFMEYEGCYRFDANQVDELHGYVGLDVYSDACRVRCHDMHILTLHSTFHPDMLSLSSDGWLRSK